MFPPLSGAGAPEMVVKVLMRRKKYWESLTPMKTSTVAVPDGIGQADNIGLHAAEAVEEDAECGSGVEGQYHVFDGVSGRQVKADAVHLEALPEVPALLNLEELSVKDFLAELKAGEIAEMVLLKPDTSPEDLNSSSVMDEDVLEGFTKQQYSDVVSKHPPSQLPPDRGVRHEIDLVSGTKKGKSGMVRESKSPHSTSIFCVRKPNGKWRLIHADNMMNNATVPTQTPIHHKDVLLNKMPGCTLYSALDLVDGYCQILIRESDIPLTAKDDEGRERVISFQSRQLKVAERNYPVHDKELLAMKYALVKFRINLLGPRPFVIFTDHASLRTATNSPHLSQRMARWLSFFAEYNFRVEY
ncbi:Reverse transcriptase-RNase H-integrase [Phytophthora palmivora]|uniref:Reverse transcriptase-RNase H-integrase n=1 Tax=Phytophthora palmivora TaxID=4796 RepID=A0A2P4YTQ5_9STRA|nr:Reverse transcriptase-RNase H-integrase [Phytophthora palmivora]